MGGGRPYCQRSTRREEEGRREEGEALLALDMKTDPIVINMIQTRSYICRRDINHVIILFDKAGECTTILNCNTWDSVDYNSDGNMKLQVEKNIYISIIYLHI